MTDITIIGSGNMARGIGIRAVAAGRSLQILDREPARAETLAAELGAQVTAGSADSIPAGAIVVLAVPYDAAKEFVVRYGAALAGKTVIDITNPIDFTTFDSLVVAPGTSAAEEIAALAAPGVNVVKAFNTTFAGTLVAGPSPVSRWTSSSPRIRPRPARRSHPSSPTRACARSRSARCVARANSRASSSS